jgi:L-amino acid N-acyltransferase YncA
LSEYSITRAVRDEYLVQILALQKINLPNNLTESEIETQGFVTCDHSPQLMKRMNHPFPHVIALHDSKVVGYALVMLPVLKNEIDVLKSMFEVIENHQFKEVSLEKSNYFVMGQVCIDKNHRSKGLFQNLYDGLKYYMSPHYNFCITEIDQRNRRSMRAHEKVGFELMTSYRDSKNGKLWDLVIWDWAK